MRILPDNLGRIPGIVHQNFLCCDGDVDRVPVGFHVKSPIGRELQQIQTRQIACRIIQEHILAARIAGIDSSRVLRGMPAIDSRVVLHPRIPAVPRSLGDFRHQLFSFIGFNNPPVYD